MNRRSWLVGGFGLLGAVILVIAQLTAAHSPLSSTLAFGLLPPAIFALFLWGHTLQGALALGPQPGFFLNVGLGSIGLYAIVSGLSFVLEFFPPFEGTLSPLIQLLLLLPALFLLMRKFRVRVLKDMQAFNKLLLFALACLVYTIWSAHSHYLGPIGHDTTQHIYWMNSIRLEGFREWTARGTDVLSAYPKGFHVWAALWAGFLPWDYGGPLVKAMPSLQTVFGVGLIVEQLYLSGFRRAKGDFLSPQEFKMAFGPVLVFLFLIAVFFKLDHNDYLESTARTSSFFLLALTLLIASPLLGWPRKIQVGLLVLSFALLLFFNPGNLVFFPVVLALLLWSMLRSKSASVRSRSLWSRRGLVLGVLACGILFEPYYMSIVLNLFPKLAHFIEEIFAMRFPWNVPNFASAASSIPQMEAGRGNFSKSFLAALNPFLKNGGFLRWYFPYTTPAYLRLSWVLLMIGSIYLMFFKSRACKGLLGIFLANWMSLIVSITFVFVLSEFMGSLNHARLLKQYGRDSYSYFAFFFWVTFFLTFLTAQISQYLRVLIVSKHFLKYRRWYSGALALMIPIMSYGGHWTFKTHRHLERLGQIFLEDMEDLENAEWFLGDKEVLLANCHLPSQEIDPTSKYREQWIASFAPSSLASVSRGSHFLCHYFLGQSIQKPLGQMRRLCAGDFEEPMFLLSWGEEYKAPPSNCPVSVPPLTEPLKRFGRVSIYKIVPE